jgi:hypothetical protein
MTSRLVLALIFLTVLISAGCHPKISTKENAPFRIIATDAGFDAPAEVPAGLRHIIYQNNGTQIHESMLVKLPVGMTPDDFVAEVKEGSLFPRGALDYSGPGLMSPGETVEVWLNVDPGQYILICWNDGHAKSTPVRPFKVGYQIADDNAPREDVVLKLADYKFELDRPLRKGIQVIRVETSGPNMHEADIFRLHPGKTLADVNEWRKHNVGGPAPADAMGGALDSHDIRRVTWLRKNFIPGRYILHCEMPVMTNGEVTNREITHADLGMVREIEIAE